MQETKGYYKQMHTNIIFSDKDIKIGTKTIKYNNIYFIREDYITNHANIFPTAFTVATGLFGILFGFLIFQRISLISMAIFALIGWFSAFYITKIKIPKENPDAYIKIIDILYTDTHESIVVPAGFQIDIQKINEKNKGIWQKKVLKNYISKLNKTRKYLVQQMETNKDLTGQELYTKYTQVGFDKYGIKNFLSAKTINVLKDNYDQCAGAYTKIGFQSARFSVMMLIILIAYAAFSGKIHYQSFF